LREKLNPKPGQYQSIKENQVMKFVLFALALLAAMSLSHDATVQAAAECAADEDKVPCLAAKGDPMAMYMMGRRAYEGARTSGDFTEALAWGQRVIRVRRHTGNMLLKMVYLQLGSGQHRDHVQAHVWLRQAIDSREANLYLVPWLERLEAKMQPEEIEKAKSLAAH
jgi:TPR repeat protein